MPGGDDDYYEDIDEGIVESFIIVGLMATLAFLVYYRNQRQLEYRRREEGGANGAAVDAGAAVGGQPSEQQAQGDAAMAAPEGEEVGMDGQQQADGGFFPPAADPEFGAWVAGGVGH